MSIPVEDLTPREIVAALDQYIVGQDAAKKAVAVALRNRYRRQQLQPEERDDVLPKNILMIGPTGVGKTEIARRLAQLARAPFVKVEATKFTEVGYVGRDVDSMIRELAANAVRLVEKERLEAVRDQAAELAEERLADLLLEQWERAQPTARPAMTAFGLYGEPEAEDADWDEIERRRSERRHEIRTQLAAGELEGEYVEVEIEEAGNPFVQVFTPQGMEEMGLDMNHLPGSLGSRRSSFRATVAEARDVLLETEGRRLVDRSSVQREAIHRTEQTGIVFLDEIDKVAIPSTGGSGPDVSREGVQRDLLPVIEGSTVQSKFGPVRTDHILFIAAGAFHMSSPSDLIPELQGRLPIRVELEPLHEQDLRRILREPKNALTKQYEKLLAVDGVDVEFTDDALDEIARMAVEVNGKLENIGARRLHTMMEKLLESELFEAPDAGSKRVKVDGALVRERLGSLIKYSDSKRNVL